MAARWRPVLNFSRVLWIGTRTCGLTRTPAARLHTGSWRGGVQESEEEFRFVERLIPPTRVPTPPKHKGPAPSGWTPPAETPPSLPYMIRRSRMHNVPVYTDKKYGNQTNTLVRRVEGDIWALEKDMKEFLQQQTGREAVTRVNEVTMTVHVKGQFDKELKEWLIQRGF